MTRRAVLHIGHPKTATTFLQHLMQLNSVALTEAGFSVPSDFRAVGQYDFAALAVAGAVYSGNGAPFFFALRDGSTPERFASYVSGPGDLLLSSELFFYWPQVVESLAAYLARKGFRVEVIAYVDRLDRMAVKAYCQNIRNHGFSGTLVQFLHATRDNGLLCYHRVHTHLRACADVASVEFRAFPREYLDGGSIERDFFHRVSPDLDVDTFERPLRTINSTLSLAELEAVRYLNSVGRTPQVQQIVARERSVPDSERTRIHRCYFSSAARDYLVRELSGDSTAFAAVMPPEQAELWSLDALPVDPYQPDPREVERVLQSIV